MPKMKTRRAAAKRFSLTKTGKIKRAKAFKSHLLNGKTLLKDVKAGQPVTMSDVDLTGSLPYDLYMKGISL